jgi:hypothetical protein
LIFNGVRPFIDGRTDLYGDAFFSRYGRIVTLDGTELERALSEYRIAWAIFPSGAPIVQMLEREPGWRLVAEGDGVVIQAREGQPAP